jgi:Polyketide cyclase / dehydrase and lipid transport
MLKILSISAVVLLAGLLVAAATRPDSFRVQRSATIHAPPEKIFPHINDLRRFNAWNPFDKKDPNLKASYSAATSGPGAEYAFEGNREVGRGRIAIVDSSPATEVRMTLDMLEPMEARNVVEFTLRPKGELTSVTWAFEKGLSDLKTIAER